MQTDRKAEILDVFMKLVSRFGIDKTTMQDVATEAGISVGVIYKDFRNKEDLIQAYLVRMQHQFMFDCRQLLEEDLPPERMLHRFIRSFFENIANLAEEDRGFLQFIKSEDTFRFFRKNIDKQEFFLDEVGAMIAAILERGVREGVFAIGADDIPKTARLFFMAFQHFGKIAIIGKESRQKMLEGVDDMFALLVRAIKRH